MVHKLVSLFLTFLLGIGGGAASTRLGDTGVGTLPPVKVVGNDIVPRNSANVYGSTSTDAHFRTTTSTTICFTGDNCRTTWPSGGGGGGTPAGTSTALQFNNAGAFGGAFLSYTQVEGQPMLTPFVNDSEDSNGYGLYIGAGDSSNENRGGGNLYLMRGVGNDGFGSISLTDTQFNSEAELDLSELDGHYTYTFPAKDGTFAMLDDIPSFTINGTSTEFLYKNGSETNTIAGFTYTSSTGAIEYDGPGTVTFNSNNASAQTIFELSPGTVGFQLETGDGASSFSAAEDNMTFQQSGFGYTFGGPGGGAGVLSFAGLGGGSQKTFTFPNVSGTLAVNTATSTNLSTASTTPASASAPCVTGTRAWDLNYIYQCVATNTWRRATTTSW